MLKPKNNIFPRTCLAENVGYDIDRKMMQMKGMKKVTSRTVEDQTGFEVRRT